ncbi:class I SAM-dependent methyltransferase [Escherichia coli]|nr:class I SAM-dependent methyltransferase [Escherichia coli]WRX85997.1 class I SAM-dependent methyltransferase [Escherichia coli]
MKISDNKNDFYPSAYSLRFTPARLSKAIDWHGHLSFAAWLMELVRPEILVELGVFRGDSLSTFSQASRDLNIKCEITGVDSWGGDNTTGAYGEEVYSEVKDYFSSSFPNTKLYRALFDEALSEFSDDSVNVLHIDGCHHYDAVKHDYETWLPKVSTENGIILFHDTNVVAHGFGSKQFWEEINSTYPSFSFNHSNGLGVLLVGKRQPNEFIALSQDERFLDKVRSIYELSGNMFIHKAKEQWWKDEADKHAAYVNHLTGDVGKQIADTINHHFVNHLTAHRQTGVFSNNNYAKRLVKKIFHR